VKAILSNSLRYLMINILLFSLLTSLVITSISIGGYYRLPIPDVLNAMLSNSVDKTLANVVDMRVRRALTSIAAGVLLAISSVPLQNILRNPLASPFTLGIQHAAALGAGVAIFIPGAMAVVGPRTASTSAVMIVNYYAVVGSAFITALAQSLFILFLSYVIGLSAYGIVLASIALSFAVQAILSLLQYLYFSEVQLATLLFWTFGDVGRTTWHEVMVLLVVAAVGITIFLTLSTDLDLVMFGDEVALSSGVNVRILRVLVLVVSSLLTAVSISLVGVIGFAGLVASHAARLTVGWSSRKCIVTSALYGATVVLLADFIGRVVLNPVTLPVGITTTIVGVPLLVVLMVGGRRGVAEGRWG